MAKRNIISLTTFPARINTVHHVVRTLLSQTVPADMVVLWLAPEQFPNREADLPQNLLELVANGLSVEWCPDIKSYKKLVPALQKFPNDNIITVDDDVLYPANMLAELIKTHNKYPDDICAHRVRKINIHNNDVLPYKTWRLSEVRGLLNTHFRASYDILPNGCGGILYPARSLDSDVLKSDLFMELCRHQDDVWFWAMAVKNNRKIVPTRHGYNLRARTMQEVQDVGLWRSINSGLDDPNNIAMNNILNKYPEIKTKLNIR